MNPRAWAQMRASRSSGVVGATSGTRASPTTPEERLARICAQARGFIYTVSVTGTTGERTGVDAGALLARVQAHATVPVALGFGIATPEQAAAAAAAGADGVIVGSRLVRAAAEDEDVRGLVAELAAALRSIAH